MKRKKKTVTLIEVLIGLALTMAVLSAIMWCYHAVVTIGHKIERDREVAFRLNYVQARLAQILPTTTGKIFFLSQRENMTSLVFLFDNGSDLDKDFGNEVLGRLYLDKAHNFCLALMPDPARWDKDHPIKQEVLYEGVDDLSFRFFTQEANWAADDSRLPAIVEVNLKIKDEIKAYRFPLPHAKEEIVL